MPAAADPVCEYISMQEGAGLFRPFFVADRIYRRELFAIRISCNGSFAMVRIYPIIIESMRFQ
jgi:hypothetical protein